jgi:gliding motility-associated-like protein
MMVVNGAGVPNVSVWCQTITVNPNTWYDFSAWGATCVGSNPAVLQFSINGGLIGTPLNLPLATGLWTQFNSTWFSGPNTSITICITNQSTAISGNDFAIDDISFREICEVSDSVFIKVVNLTPSIQRINLFGCDEDTIQFSADNGSGDIPFSYLWSFGDGNFSGDPNPLHIYGTQGIYNVKLVTELSGCKDSSLITVNTLHPLVADFSVDDTFCVAQVVTTADNSVSTAPSVYSWDWGDGTVTPTNFHTYTVAGTYTIRLIVTDAIGCSDTTYDTVHILDAPFVQFTVSDDIVCVGDPIFFTDSTNMFTELMVWDFGDGYTLRDVHNPSYRYDQAGTYIITLTGSNSKCAPSTFTQTVEVKGYPNVNLGPDTMICPGITGSILIANAANPREIYTWSTGETANAITVTQPGLYWVNVTTANSECSSSDSIWVKRDCYLNIPNSFSPNGDGRNDYFLPRELLSSGLSSFSMSLFNRWGELIFTTNSVDGRGWDGTYNGEDQPLGVYVYIINARFNNGIGKEFTGNVTLIR